MPRLLALDHIYIGHWEHITAVGIARRGRELAILAPEIRVTDIMVVRDTNRRAILHDLAKLETKFNPAGGMLGMAIGLVAREEEEVGILPEEVIQNLGSRTRSPTGVTRHVRDDDRILGEGIATHQAFEGRGGAVANAVSDRLRTIPARYTEVGAPTWKLHDGLGGLDPLAVALEL